MHSNSLMSSITGNTNLKLVVKLLGILFLTAIVVYNLIQFIDSPSTYFKDVGEALVLIGHG